MNFRFKGDIGCCILDGWYGVRCHFDCSRIFDINNKLSFESDKCLINLALNAPTDSKVTFYGSATNVIWQGFYIDGQNVAAIPNELGIFFRYENPCLATDLSWADTSF